MFLSILSILIILHMLDGDLSDFFSKLLAVLNTLQRFCKGAQISRAHLHGQSSQDWKPPHLLALSELWPSHTLFNRSVHFSLPWSPRQHQFAAVKLSKIKNVTHRCLACGTEVESIFLPSFRIGGLPRQRYKDGLEGRSQKVLLLPITPDQLAHGW